MQFRKLKVLLESSRSRFWSVSMNEMAAGNQLASRQFTLRSLLAVTAFVVLGLWSWSLARFEGVALFTGFVFIVAVNLAIAFFGAKFHCGGIASVLGGATLWSVVLVAVVVLDSGVITLIESLVFPFAGILAGCVCGVYAKRKSRRADGGRRRGIVFCGILLLSLLADFGAAQCLQQWKLRQDDFNSVCHYDEPDSDGTYLVEMWGHGITDDSLAWQLDEIPSNRKLAVSFRYTRVTDEGPLPR